MNPAGARFCFNCGAKMESRCAGCNAPLQGAERFCPSCGQPTAPGQAPPAPREAAPREAAPPTARPPAATGPIDFEDPAVRLKRQSFNSLMTDLFRRRQRGADSPEATFRAAVDAFEAYLTNLENDPDPKMAALAPAFTKAAFVHLYFVTCSNALAADQRVSLGNHPARHRVFFKQSQSPGAEPEGILDKQTATDIMVTACRVALGMFWQPGEFCTVEQVFAQEPARFAEVVCQSLRELFYLTYPTVALKKRFLAEEDCKVKNGYYQGAVADEVRRLLVRLGIACERLENELKPGMARDAVLFFIAPLANPELIELSAQGADRAGMDNPYALRTLTATEESSIAWLVANGLEPAGAPADQLLTVLMAMRDEQESLAEKYLAWLREEANMRMGRIDATRASIFMPVYMVIETAVFVLTRYCNILGPRVRAGYRQLAYRAWQLPGASWEKLKAEWAKNDKDYANAMIPECGNVEAIYRELQAQSAKNAPAPSGAAHP